MVEGEDEPDVHMPLSQAVPELNGENDAILIEREADPKPTPALTQGIPQDHGKKSKIITKKPISKAKKPASKAKKDKKAAKKPDMVLHGYWRSGATWRVRLALALKGFHYGKEIEYVPVNLVKGE